MRTAIPLVDRRRHPGWRGNDDRYVLPVDCGLACVAGGVAAVAGPRRWLAMGVAAVVEVVGTLAVNRWKRSHMSKPHCRTIWTSASG